MCRSKQLAGGAGGAALRLRLRLGLGLGQPPRRTAARCKCSFLQQLPPPRTPSSPLHPQRHVPASVPTYSAATPPGATAAAAPCYQSRCFSSTTSSSPSSSASSSSSSRTSPSGKFAELSVKDLAALAASNARRGTRDLKVFDALSDRLRSGESKLQASQIVELAWAAAKSRVRQPGLLDRLAAMVLPDMPTLDGRSVATLAWSFAKLSLRRRHLEILEAADLASDPAHRLADFKPQDLSNILWSCGSAKYNGKATLDAVLSVAQGRIGEFESQGLSNVLWALAKLDYEHHGFVDAYSTRIVQEGADNFSPQELSNSAWALAKLKRKDANVMAVLTHRAVEVWDASARGTASAEGAGAAGGAEVARTPRGFRPQELSNLTWAAAKLDCTSSRFSKFWDAASEFSMSSMQELGPQELAMIAWAFATASRKDEALFDSIAAAVASLDTKEMGDSESGKNRRRSNDSCKSVLNEQDCANLLWAFATVKIRDPSLLSSVLGRIESLQSGKATVNSGGLSPQNLATVCWSLATLRVEEEQRELWTSLLRASSEAAEQGQMRHPQDLAGVLWAVATVPTVLEASGAVAQQRQSSSLLQPLVEAAAKCSKAWKPQDLSNLAWACSTLDCDDGPLWEDVSGVLTKHAKFQREELEATLVALCSVNAEAAESLARKLESKKLLTPLGFGALLGSAEEKASVLRQVSWLWSVATAPEHRAARPGREREGSRRQEQKQKQEEEDQEQEQEQEQGHQPKKQEQEGLPAARDPFALAALCVAARRLLRAADLEGAKRLLEEHAARLSSQDYISDSVVEKLKKEVEVSISAGIGSADLTEGLPELLQRPPGRALAQAARGSKAALLLNYVRSHATFGDPISVCRSIEQFSVDVLSQKRQWFKIVGPEKAQIMLDSFREAPAEGILLEIGTYLGYSSMRFAIDDPTRRIISLEVEPTHALTAQYLIEFAGLQDRIEVWSGHSQTSLRRLKAQKEKVSAVFMDQCGSRFWQDFEAVHATGLVNEGAIVIADNVLKPGAPRYLYHLHRGPVSDCFDAKVVSVPEFGMVDVEDWLSVATVKVSEPWKDRSGSQAMPEKVVELEWFAKLCRERAEGAAGSVPFESWSQHSAEMRLEMKTHFDIAPE